MHYTLYQYRRNTRKSYFIPSNTALVRKRSPVQIRLSAPRATARANIAIHFGGLRFFRCPKATLSAQGPDGSGKRTIKRAHPAGCARFAMPSCRARGCRRAGYRSVKKPFFDNGFACHGNQCIARCLYNVPQCLFIQWLFRKDDGFLLFT